MNTIDNAPVQGQGSTRYLAAFIRAIYADDDAIGYTDDIRVATDGIVSHGREITRIASDILASLEHYPGDLGATISDHAARDGALIRFNAPGRYDNATMEFKGLAEEEQLRACDGIGFPVACVVGNGDDLQVIVRVGAKDAHEYGERLDFLSTVVKAKGYTVTCNTDPAGYIRMPGSCVNGSLQRFVPPSEPPASWKDWQAKAEELIDDLPPVLPLSECFANPPKQPEPLIDGILRQSHKMIISGPSKSGKSFLLMALCIAIAEGISWLGFPCRPGRALYVNLEIDPASCIERFLSIYKALDIEPRHADNIDLWNLRGHAAPLEQLATKVISRAKARAVNAVILDPFYKLNNGDENNAGDMARFVNHFDNICAETGASVIYSHHHSKSSSDRRTIDRPSGSTVFARDPDAILDMVRLEKPKTIKADVSPSAIPLRMDFVLREFASPQPINLWFEFPLHCLDVDGDLDGAAIEGASQGQRQKSKKGNSAGDGSYSGFVTAFESLADNPPVTVKGMAARLGVSEHTIRDRIKVYDDFSNYRGVITRDTG